MLVIPSPGPTMDPSYPGKISTELAVQASKAGGGGCGHLLFLAVARMLLVLTSRSILTLAVPTRRLLSQALPDVVAVPRIANCLSQLTSHDFYPTSPPTRLSLLRHHFDCSSGVELLGGVKAVWLAAVPGHTHTNHQSTHQQSVTGEGPNSSCEERPKIHLPSPQLPNCPSGMRPCHDPYRALHLRACLQELRQAHGRSMWAR
jgi:hypothetical protein